MRRGPRASARRAPRRLAALAILACAAFPAPASATDGPRAAADPIFVSANADFAARGGADGITLEDRGDGRIVTFAYEPLALRLGRFGRVACISATAAGGYEVHRADLAERDTLLDSGPRIVPRSLRILRGKLLWKNGSKTKRADLDGKRGDKPPIEDPHLRLIPGTSEVNGPGPALWRYGVEVEDGLPVDRVEFAQAIDDILSDQRGWLGAGSRISLLRVDQPPYDFTVTLAKPETVDRLCLPLHTGSRVSCENRGRSVINWLRWSTGSPYWSDRAKYRHYLINHEVGHSLGHKHRFCGGRGKVAPVMQQQTGPATPCTHAQWPKRLERALSRTPEGERIPAP